MASSGGYLASGSCSSNSGGQLRSIDCSSDPYRSYCCMRYDDQGTAQPECCSYESYANQHWVMSTTIVVSIVILSLMFILTIVVSFCRLVNLGDASRGSGGGETENKYSKKSPIGARRGGGSAINSINQSSGAGNKTMKPVTSPGSPRGKK